LRDPLAWIPVRYKLPLTFAFLCLVAFGLGGYLVTATARDALHQQIQLRLNERATSLNLVVDKSLELLGRRVEDFASDGFIRLQAEGLATAAEDAVGQEGALIRHLRVNKLPLVEEFVDGLILDRDGIPVLRAHTLETMPPPGFDREALWIGPLTGPGQEYPFPTFVLSAPLVSLQGDRRLGFLLLVVRADAWAGKLGGALSFPGAQGFTAYLGSPEGHVLELVAATETLAGATEPAADPSSIKDEDRIRFASTIARTGWTLDLAVDRDVLTIPVDTMVLKFFYLGMALVVLTLGLLLFPRQFLLKPLTALQDAARRMAEGDFSARVESSSRDEVGELAGAFNFMAAAVEERTRNLKQSASTLERREADIRFERDRLNTVIRSMEDGLFIMDAQGRVTLSNAAAKPVLAALGKGGDITAQIQCNRRGSETSNCLHCIADFANDVQGCVVSVGTSIFEINGAVLPGPREAVAGKVFVSRDVTSRVHHAEQEAHQERLSVLGEIAAVMAHELNNPLAAISMFSQMLLKGLDTGSGMHSHAQVIYRNTESCKATIRALLDMATTATSESARFDLHQLVMEVEQLLEPVAHREGVAVKVVKRADDPCAFGDELQLRQAVVNLVMNAIQAFVRGGGGQVTMEIVDRGDEVAVVVGDQGPGIAPEAAEHIFEPFFTTKPPGQGTGLGLPTSRRIVDAQGGRLNLVETGPRGTVFEIVMPRRDGARPARLEQAVAGGRDVDGSAS
jgi:signal transduction histidine kinase